MPANLPFDSFSIKLHQISYPVPELAFPFLLNHLHLHTIRSFHLSSLFSIDTDPTASFLTGTHIVSKNGW
jgi:hypothetical protein